jgi:DNA replication protein DnaC
MIANKQPTSKKNQFRISAKRIYLTYSQVNKEMQNLDVLQALQRLSLRLDFKYLISKEYHLDGGTHFHVVLEANTKFDIRQHDLLDITYQDKSYHGNYQAVRSLPLVVKYVCKSGDYITDFTNIQQGKLLTTKELLIQSATQLGVSNALIEHCKQLPNKALPNLSLVSAKAYFQQLEKLKQSSQAADVSTPFKLKDFNFKENKELSQWMQDPTKTLVLAGPSGTGKTQFCKAFAQDKGHKTLVVSHLEDFKHLTHQHDCIIVDDANMHTLEATQLLAAIDNQQNKTLRVLYNAVNKKPGLIQMFTMNKQEFFEIKDLLKQERFARRMLFSELKGSIINLNVNIQINNITNNYGDLKHSEQTQMKENIRRMDECV